LKLSVEHSGFTFQSEPKKAAEMIKLHSGGKTSEALLMAMDKESVVLPNSPDRRRSKYQKDIISSRNVHDDQDDAAIDLLPPVPRKNIFCCFNF
jgi:hypothetical protein